MYPAYVLVGEDVITLIPKVGTTSLSKAGEIKRSPKRWPGNPVALIREPFDRLVSAYCMRYRQHTFEDFLEAVVRHPDIESVDLHVRPQYWFLAGDEQLLKWTTIGRFTPHHVGKAGHPLDHTEVALTPTSKVLLFKEKYAKDYQLWQEAKAK